ncbi:MAG TPA: hypothetical protein VJ083_03965 [Sedimentibacter sp.]|nr:hypothetical protein [Sedimentibacter sp.]
MTLKQLYDYAEENDINIDNFSLPDAKACCVALPNGDMRIGIDVSHAKSTAEEKELLGHELAHCMKNAFHYLHSPPCVRSKAEHRALCWEAENFMPKQDLVELFRAGITEMWEIAEYFEVTESFVIRVCKLYGFIT